MFSRFSKKDGLICILLAGVCLYLFRDIVFGGHLLLGSDFAAFYLGMKQFLLDEIWNNHTIPLWNPYVFGGIPFWAHFESTIFYPLDILFLLIPPEHAYGYTMCLHLILAACFMYLLTRSLNMGHAASFVSAMVYSFNGFIIPTLSKGQMFRVQGYIWIPLILYFLNRAIKAKRPYSYGSLAGLLWGVQILSGSPQDAFYTFFLSFLFLVTQSESGKPILARTRSIVVLFSLFFLVGAGLASIQIIPAFEFIGQSVRAALDDYALVTLGSYPPEGIVTALMPYFYGSYLEWNFWVSDLPWSIPFYNLYVGILPLLLMFFIRYRQITRDRLLAFAMGLACLVFFLALGSNLPIYKLLYHLPGFDRIRAPEKIIVIWAFAWSLLAGKGMDALLRTQEKPFLMRRAVIAVILGLCLVALDLLLYGNKALVLKVFAPFILDQAIPEKMAQATLHIRGQFHYLAMMAGLIILVFLLKARGTLKRAAAAIILCGLLVLDLGFINHGAVQQGDKLYAWTKEAKANLTASIGRDKSIYRVGSYRYGMGANIEMYMGFQTVGGYNPLFLNRYYEYINQYRSTGPPFSKGWIIFFYEDRRDGRLMDLLNLKYVISYAKGSYALRQTALPRAFIVPGAETAKREEVLDMIVSPGFNPREVVLLEEEQPGKSGKKEKGITGSPGRAKILSYNPDEIILQVKTAAPAYLFLSEVHYPGWKATVDGRQVKILRGNYLFRVIPVPEGSHNIRVFFDPWTVKTGVFISLLTLSAVCIGLVLGRRRRKPDHPREET
ncbi:YfhO family protein [Thermodesulfobacteriota bacterium]